MTIEELDQKITKNQAEAMDALRKVYKLLGDRSAGNPTPQGRQEIEKRPVRSDARVIGTVQYKGRKSPALAVMLDGRESPRRTWEDGSSSYFVAFDDGSHTFWAPSDKCEYEPFGKSVPWADAKLANFDHGILQDTFAKNSGIDDDDVPF